MTFLFPFANRTIYQCHPGSLATVLNWLSSPAWIQKIQKPSQCEILFVRSSQLKWMQGPPFFHSRGQKPENQLGCHHEWQGYHICSHQYPPVQRRSLLEISAKKSQGNTAQNFEGSYFSKFAIMVRWCTFPLERTILIQSQGSLMNWNNNFISEYIPSPKRASGANFIHQHRKFNAPDKEHLICMSLIDSTGNWIMQKLFCVIPICHKTITNKSYISYKSHEPGKPFSLWWKLSYILKHYRILTCVNLHFVMYLIFYLKIVTISSSMEWFKCLK